MLPSRSLYKNSFQNRGKKNITVHVAVHEAWDFLVNMDTCFCLKAPACPQADEVEQFPPSHKYGYLLCFRLRLLCLFHSRYAFFFFFPTSIPIPLCSLLSLCGRGSSGFCLGTVLNIEHKRKRDTRAKASFWYSNYEKLFGWYNSHFLPVYLWFCASFLYSSKKIHKRVCQWVRDAMCWQLSINIYQLMDCEINTPDRSFWRKIDISVSQTNNNQHMCSFHMGF